MRVLAVDLGSKRIGVAISDSGPRVATPLQVLKRTGDRARDHRAVSELVAEWEVDMVLVGLPISLDGTIGPAAQGVLAEVDEMIARLPVPVTTYDERLTTVSADRSLMEQGRSSKERRAVVDMVAAAVLLQAWIDSHHGSSE